MTLRDHRWGLLVCAGGVFVLGTLLFAHRQSPMFGDYAEWTYHGVLFRDALRGHADAGYVLKRYPVPNSLTTVGLGLLMLLMPWKVAAKVWLLCEVMLGVVAAVGLQKAAGRAQSWQLPVFTAAALLGIGFWAGFTNFLLGTYIAMLLCACMVRGVESRWFYSALLLAAFFSHMVPFGFAVLLLGFYALQTGRWKLLWASAPALGMALWYFVGRAGQGDADGQAGMVSSVPYASAAFVAFKANSFLKCWGFVNPAFTFTDSVLLRVGGTQVFVLLFLLNALIAVAMLVLLSRTALRSIRNRTELRFVWLAIVSFAGVGLLLPGAAAGISDPGGRMLQVALWSGVCLVGTRSRWLGTAMGASAVVLLVADLALIPAVALKPPMQGSEATALPAVVREFGHTYYADRAADYDALEAHRMDLPIYPTAMFLKR